MTALRVVPDPIDLGATVQPLVITCTRALELEAGSELRVSFHTDATGPYVEVAVRGPYERSFTPGAWLGLNWEAR